MKKKSIEQTRKYLKDDINFLENPIFIIDDKSTETELVKKKGTCKFVLSGEYGLPHLFDKKVLYYIQLLLQESGVTDYTVHTSRYHIAVGLGTSAPGAKVYEDIMQALKIYASIVCDFDQVFYENGCYISKVFHILDSVELNHKTGRLSIRFNQDYIDCLNKTQFYATLDILGYISLSKAGTARLYEILAKSFIERKYWACSLQNLATKIGFKKRDLAKCYYASDVIRLVNVYVKEINETFNVNFVFNFDKDSQVCKFTYSQAIKRIQPAKKADPEPVERPVPIEHVECYNFYASLPENERKRIDQLIRNDFSNAIPDEKARIFSFMSRKKIWQPQK